MDRLLTMMPLLGRPQMLSSSKSSSSRPAKRSICLICKGSKALSFSFWIYVLHFLAQLRVL
ncbi:unnamed protein product [Rhodiola kirilowii]